MEHSRAKPALTPGQQTALSNHINLSIMLFLLQRPATLSDVADAYHLLPLEANLRLRQLMEQGLVTSTYREGPGGTRDRVYQATIDDFELNNQVPDSPMSNADQVQLLLGQLRQDLIYQVLHGDKSQLHLRSIGIRTTPEKFQEWLKRMWELESEFEAGDDNAERSWYYITVAMYPQPDRRNKQQQGREQT